MSNPPTIDIAIAGTAIRPLWASNAGRAVDKHKSAQILYNIHSNSPISAVFYHRCEKRARTNTHNHQKPRTKFPKIHHGTSSTLHKIIGIRTSPTYPVRQRGDHVGRHDKQGQVAVEEGGGEDDEEEAYGEDLAKSVVIRVLRPEEGDGIEKRDERRLKHTKDRAMIVLRPAAILFVCRVHWLGP